MAMWRLRPVEAAPVAPLCDNQLAQNTSNGLA